MRRRKGLLIDKHVRQLILYSTIIEMPYYKKLKEVLSKYETIYESDFEDTDDFDNEVKKIIKYSIKEVSESAEREWYTKGDNCDVAEDYENNPIKCQLCNTNNKYIFYIVNKENHKELNVGSDCIMSFPSLSKINGQDIRKIKNIKIREVEKIKRISEFNTEFPDVQEMIRDFETDYNNIPICIPYKIYFRIPNILKEMRNIYSDYIKNKGKENAFIDFSKLIEEYMGLQYEIEKHIESNKDNNLVCNRNILNWLNENGKYEVVEAISKNNGLYDKDTIEFVTKNSFLRENFEIINKSLMQTEFHLVSIKDGNVYLEYKNKQYNKALSFYMTNIDFMHFYGASIFISGNIIGNDDIKNRLKIEFIKSNFITIINRFSIIIKKMGYQIEYNEERNRATYKNIQKGSSGEIDFREFVRNNIELLFKNDLEIGNRYKTIFDKITWRDISEEKKYEVNENMLSKNPYS